jgi:heme-degrading monooxygenase HmoA
MAFMMTRAQVGDYDAFKPMFDQDPPGARRAAKGHRLYRNVDDPNEVFVQVHFESVDEARAGRERLLASGVLDRWQDKSGPTIVEEAEAVDYGRR